MWFYQLPPTPSSSQLFFNQWGVVGVAHAQCTKNSPYVMTQCLWGGDSSPPPRLYKTLVSAHCRLALCNHCPRPYYGLGDDFPCGQLLTRSVTGKKRNIYLTSQLVKELLHRNELHVKVRVYTCTCLHVCTASAFRYLHRNTLAILIEQALLWWVFLCECIIYCLIGRACAIQQIYPVWHFSPHSDSSSMWG